MLKIVLIEADGNAVLRLEGLVVGPWVEEVRRSCEGALAGRRRLTLDLASVCFVDRDGIELFRRLSGRDVVLANCSRFVEEQLKA
jgi:hypothetical protein